MTIAVKRCEEVIDLVQVGSISEDKLESRRYMKREIHNENNALTEKHPFFLVIFTFPSNHEVVSHSHMCYTANLSTRIVLGAHQSSKVPRYPRLGQEDWIWHAAGPIHGGSRLF